MPEELVDDVRLWCVERSAVMPDVLSRMENLEAEAVQEFSLR